MFWILRYPFHSFVNNLTLTLLGLVVRASSLCSRLSLRWNDSIFELEHGQKPIFAGKRLTLLFREKVVTSSLVGLLCRFIRIWYGIAPTHKSFIPLTIMNRRLDGVTPEENLYNREANESVYSWRSKLIWLLKLMLYLNRKAIDIYCVMQI